MGSDVAHIRVARRQHIRTRFSDEVLQSLRRLPGSCQRQRQVQPACVPLTYFSTDYLRLGGFRTIGGDATRDECKGTDKDYNSRYKKPHEDRSFDCDGLILSIGKGYTWVGEMKRVVVRFDLVEAIADQRQPAGL